jgi:hypothetical protein
MGTSKDYPNFFLFVFDARDTHEFDFALTPLQPWDSTIAPVLQHGFPRSGSSPFLHVVEVRH